MDQSSLRHASAGDAPVKGPIGESTGNCCRIENLSDQGLIPFLFYEAAPKPAEPRKQLPGEVTGRSWIVYAECIHHTDSTSQPPMATSNSSTRGQVKIPHLTRL
jgi:hypothetical protein